MAWRNNIDNSNMQLANVFSSRGTLENISGYLYGIDAPRNFIISGGVDPIEKYQPLFGFFNAIVGQCPLIVLHNNNKYLEAAVLRAWQHLWLVNYEQQNFEPFFGMDSRQVVHTLRQLAIKLHYNVTPRFERVVQAHIDILRELNVPISLSGFNYLCQFYDMGEFYDNIMTLPCSESISRRIWTDLGVDTDSANSQFDLFRATINNLVHSVSGNGWNQDNNVSEYNCIEAIRHNATMIFSIEDVYSELLLPYIVEELKMSNMPFVLILDNVNITDADFRDYLLQNNGNYLGIVSNNVVEMIGGNEEYLLRLAEKMSAFVLFKHGTGGAARILSEIFGRYDHMNVAISQGINRGFFDILPRNRHEGVQYSVENRYRVMPEEITALQYGQAIILDTITDQIIYYN